MASEIYATLGMQGTPFSPGACKDFYYQTAASKRITDELLQGISAHKGFMVLVGEVGLGKTSLLLQLLPILEQQKTHASLIFNNVLDKRELLTSIVKGFGLKVPEAPHLAELLDTLHAFFLDANSQGKNCAIIIDEAQKLDFQALEILRMLSNLELGGEKLVQILLVGQPELHHRLSQPELLQLRNRINLFHELPPLNQEETGDYVRYKLSTVGSDLKLEGASLGLLWLASQGNPLMTNMLMEKTLYAMLARGESRITRGTVLDAVKEVAAWDSSVARTLRFMRIRRSISYTGGVLALGLAIGVLLLFWQPWRESGQQSSVTMETGSETSEPVHDDPGKQQAANPSATENSEPDAAAQSAEQLSSASAQEKEEGAVQSEPDASAESAREAEAQESAVATATPEGDSPAEVATADTVGNPDAEAAGPSRGALQRVPPKSELAHATAAFLEPWGIEDALQHDFYQAVEANDPDYFRRKLKEAGASKKKGLTLVELQEVPEVASGGDFKATRFHWQQFSEFGPVWVVLWRSPVFLDDYAMEYRSKSVIRLQERLDLLGYYRLGIDGKVGPGTWKAVEEFQDDHGLPVTGTPDPATVFLLFTTNRRAPISVRTPQENTASQEAITPDDSPQSLADGSVRFGVQ